MPRLAMPSIALLALATSVAAAEDVAANSHTSSSRTAATEEDPARLVAEAERHFNETCDVVNEKMATLLDFKTMWQKMNPDSILRKCLEMADKDVGKDASGRKEELDQLLDQFRDAATAPSKADVLAVKEKAHAIFQGEKQQVRLLHKVMKGERKAALAKCKEVGHDALQALRAQQQAARKLEAARKEAGQPQHAFEGKYQQALLTIERQQGQAESEMDSACDEAEAQFGKVEHVVEAMADKTNDEAIDTVEDIVDSCLRHIGKLQHKQDQVASSNHSSSDSEGAQPEKDASGSLSGRSKALAASLAALSAPASAKYLCMGLLLAITMVALLMSKQRGNRTIAPRPLLG